MCVFRVCFIALEGVYPQFSVYIYTQHTVGIAERFCRFLASENMLLKKELTQSVVQLFGKCWNFSNSHCGFHCASLLILNTYVCIFFSLPHEFYAYLMSECVFMCVCVCVLALDYDAVWYSDTVRYGSYKEGGRPGNCGTTEATT